MGLREVHVAGDPERLQGVTLWKGLADTEPIWDLILKAMGSY